MSLIPYAGKDSYSQAWGITLGAGRPSVPVKPHAKRNKAILRRHRAGHSHADIAADYRLTVARVGEIVTALGGKRRVRALDSLIASEA